MENDKILIDQIVSRFFSLFVSRDLGTVDLYLLREIFIPEALVIKTGGGATDAMTLDQFIEPRQKILTDGSLLNFKEFEVREETKIFGNLASRVCVYEKSGQLNGQPYGGRGTKSFQFVKLNGNWKISSLSWEDEP